MTTILYYIIFRILSFIILFTPSLGLFDCLHHGRLGSIPVQDGQRIFDVSLDGVQLNFSNAWEPYKIKDISYFPDMTVSAVSALLVSMVLFHTFVSILILKLLLRKPFGTELFIQAIHSFLTPPLHLDWELLYRRDTKINNVVESWKK